MKGFTLFIFILISVNNLFSQNYILIWSDEFDGISLNTNVWTRETGGNGWGNNEWQYYTDRTDNSFLQDGLLHIVAKEESYGGKDYTSARLITKDKKYYKYGKIEARLKLPFGQGIWPAFWTLGQSISSVGWPACGEIDIMEMVGGSGRENTIHGTAHWDDNGHKQYGQSYTLSSGTFSDDFHIFSIEWTPTFIKWYVDGILYNTMNTTPAYLSELQEEHFILLNVAVGGNWPGYPDSTTQFPQEMLIDYVRVYADESKVPNVSISQPAGVVNLQQNDSLEIVANVSFLGIIEKVRFYQGSGLIGETKVPPYKMNWTNLYPGEYLITAEAITSEGYTNLSSGKSVIVEETPTTSPYLGYLNKIPGLIEAEEFDLDGLSLGYSDTDAINQGGKFRLDTGVDIETCFDDYGNFNVGWMIPGEFLKYKVFVKETGEYDFIFRIASLNGGGKLSVFYGGTKIIDNAEIPSTGGHQNWIDVTVNNVSLNEGESELSLNVISGGFNLNYFEVCKTNSSEEINVLSPTGTSVLSAGSIINIKWETNKVKEVKIGFSSDNGGSWQFVSNLSNAKLGVERWRSPVTDSDECLIMIIDASNATLFDITEPFTLTTSTSISDQIEEFGYKLFDNYPNPFNPSTIISFTIPFSGTVNLKIFNSLGELVKSEVFSNLNSGNHQYNFNAAELTSGIYYYSLISGNFKETKKMLLLK